jgi:hypothetical protein
MVEVIAEMVSAVTLRDVSWNRNGGSADLAHYPVVLVCWK